MKIKLPAANKVLPKAGLKVQTSTFVLLFRKNHFLFALKNVN